MKILLSLHQKDLRQGVAVNCVVAHSGGVWALKFRDQTIITGSSDTTVTSLDCSLSLLYQSAR